MGNPDVGGVSNSLSNEDARIGIQFFLESPMLTDAERIKRIQGRLLGIHPNDMTEAEQDIWEIVTGKTDEDMDRESGRKNSDLLVDRG